MYAPLIRLELIGLRNRGLAKRKFLFVKRNCETLTQDTQTNPLARSAANKPTSPQAPERRTYATTWFLARDSDRPGAVS